MSQLVITRRSGQSFDAVWPTGDKVRVRLVRDSRPILITLDDEEPIELPVSITLDGLPGTVDVMAGERNDKGGGRKLLIRAPQNIAIQRDDMRRGPRP